MGSSADKDHGIARRQENSLIPRHGGFRKLKSFQIAQLVYDITVRFCARYIDRRSRTHDQMTQAARSGAQNIAEGSVASATSKKTEMKLTGVARASLAELLQDYEDFLRQRRLRIWEDNDPRRAELIARRAPTADAVAEWVRMVHEREAVAGRYGQNGRNGQSGQRRATVSAGTSTQSTSSIQSTRPSTYAEIAANVARILVTVTLSLLDRQLAAQAAAFEREGGFTEKLYRTRSEQRERQRRNPGDR